MLKGPGKCQEDHDTLTVYRMLHLKYSWVLNPIEVDLNQTFSFDKYIKEVASKLRRYEAERIRGDLARLEELEHTTDLTLVRKWGWVSAIVGAGFSFILLPFITGIVQHYVPDWVGTLLWSIVKVSMGMTLLMLGVTIYFTIAHTE